MEASRSSSLASLTSKEGELPNRPTLSQHSQPENEEQPVFDPTPVAKNTTEHGPNSDPFLAKWEPEDNANPRNWSAAYKWWITLQLGLLALTASLASSITAPAEPAIAEYTGVSVEVTVLSISLYV